MTPRLSAWLLLVLTTVNAGVLKRDVSGNELEQQIGRLPELDLSRSSTGELSNHTSAVIELVLQNVHRLKNFEERARLERLVTRFKTLVDELQRPTHEGATLPDDQQEIDAREDEPRMPDLPAINLYQGIPEPQNMKQQNIKDIKRTHNADIDISLDHPPTHSPTRESKTESASTVTSTSLPLKSSSPASQAIPSREPITFQGEEDIDDDLDEDEDDELGGDDDIDDDELVKELRHGSHPANSLHLEFVPPGSNMATPRRNQPRHRSDPAASPAKSDIPDIDWQPSAVWPPLDPIRDAIPPLDVSDNKANPQVSDDSEQVDNDVKLLNTVIGNLRQVKEVLQRMRHNR